MAKRKKLPKRVLRSTLLKARAKHRRDLARDYAWYRAQMEGAHERWLQAWNDAHVRTPLVSAEQRDAMNEATLARLRMILANIMRDWTDRIPAELIAEVEAAIYHGVYRKPLPESTLRTNG